MSTIRVVAAITLAVFLVTGVLLAYTLTREEPADLHPVDTTGLPVAPPASPVQLPCCPHS